MSKSTILVIFVATALALQVTAQPPTTPTYLLSFCRIKMGNYTTNSTYQANLQSVLKKLDGLSSTAPFSNASSGSQVFGQYYCRGDVDSALCHDCVQQAAKTVFTNCTHFKSAVVWYDECTLRYDNTSMVGVEAERPLFYTWSLTNVTDPDDFGATVNKTMDTLINKTAYGDDSLSFATGEGVVPGTETVYCLVQCSRDLNGIDCDTCLRDSYRDFVVPNLRSRSVKVFSPSCQLRYTTVTKANPPEAAAPSPPMTPSPSPSLSEQPPSPMTMSSPSPSPSSSPAPVAIASPPPTGGSAKLKKEEILNLGLVISTAVFALLCFG